MSSVTKGDAFEKRVFLALTSALESQRLGLLPNSCAIFQKKSYYSRDRGAPIIVDISIEVTVPNATAWSLLWVWECKDLSYPMRVDDVEEFWAKLQQIGGTNVKGGIASSGTLQRSALHLAAAKGIAVVRLLPTDQVRWALYHPLSMDALDEFELALIDPDFRSSNSDFYGLDSGHCFDNWFDLLANSIATKPRRANASGV